MGSEKKRSSSIFRASVQAGCVLALATSAAHGTTPEIYQALRQAQNAYQLAPDNTQARRQYIFALRDARLSNAALAMAQRYPNAVSSDELRVLQADEAAELTRLASTPSRNQEERYRLADQALQRYDQYLNDWQKQGLSDTAIYRRIELDRLQALHARQSMQTLVDTYEAMQRRGVTIPSYLLNEIASAYLYLKQPEKATALFQAALNAERLDSAEVNDDELAYYYALQESGEHAAARAHLTALSNRQGPWRRVAGNPQPLPNENFLNTARTSAIDPIYAGQVGNAIDQLQQLADEAPRDAGLRIALGNAQYLQGFHRQAEVTLKQAESLEPQNPELISAQGMNALSLHEWEQARLLKDYAVTHYPESPATQRLKEEWETQQKYELQISAVRGHATDSPVTGGKDFRTEATLYTPTSDNGMRYFGGAGYAQGDFEEGELNQRWLRAGAQWRTRDLIIEGDVSSQQYGYGTKIGARAAATAWLNDQWQVGAQAAWRPVSTPMRALKNNIWGKRLDLWVQRNGKDDSQWLLAFAPTRFSDGNQRFEARLSGRERLYSSAEFTAHLELDVSASRNSRTDVPYFSPRQDLEVFPGLVLTQTLYQRYDTVVTHSLQLRAGLYKQRDYSAGSVMAVGYGVRYQTGKNVDIQANVLGVRRPYDGKQERELRFQLELNLRF
ncbi:poly-beta-1,6 N-acetyl-D-glucosamine export porin PgaA [Pusillimonas sp. NJUB218]|uniref:poly-beta-1,6 N-acetyl-D-glucosamine export porin PgaA n=1 Tax=Pusillimonas sp. NJUB218 TaxID=2023230 RepID=UPI000F4D0A12|nr:poly-beta-1,6 N-acetyl-D-glucosamine export porin PgaA [Pusillimonas sp. NJUB218]ROT44441.1 poly-beta-1,6 N-acetyl-D-glucosamine export porin PgaA [Pusillimonas sp. NJUB218]